jgi:hypothetical protein
VRGVDGCWRARPLAGIHNRAHVPRAGTWEPLAVWGTANHADVASCRAWERLVPDRHRPRLAHGGALLGEREGAHPPKRVDEHPS